MLPLSQIGAGVERGWICPSSLKTKITAPLFAETRDFYVTCLGMWVVEQWREADEVGCTLALAGGTREALLGVRNHYCLR